MTNLKQVWFNHLMQGLKHRILLERLLIGKFSLEAEGLSERDI